MKYHQIKKVFDWRGYLETHFTYKPTNGSKGEEYRVCCPSCKESDFKCYVNLDRKIFNCFKCDFSSRKNDVYDFVAATEGMSRQQATMHLFQEYKDITPETVDFTQLETPTKAVVALKTLEKPSYIHPILPITEDSKMYYDYLLNDRKFTEVEIQQTQAHYCTHTPFGELDISHRVLWLVYGGDGQLVSYVARDITGSHPQKYINAKHSDLNKVLWPNIKPKTKTVILVEGIIDCIALRRLYTDVYCTFGKHLGDDQIKILKSYDIDSVVFLWDKKDAKPQMKHMAEKLKTRFKYTFVANFSDWPSNKDTGDFMKHPEMEQAIRTAIDKRINVDTEDYITWQLT